MSTSVTDDLPSPPRPLTARAKRRAWAEPRVRVWWMLALTVIVVALLIVGSRVIANLRDLSLVRHGIPVEAKVLKIAGADTPGKLFGAELNAEFELQYTPPNGQTITTIERLRAQKEPIAIGQTIPLRIDANNPRHWTDRTEITWTEDLLPGLILLPLIILLFAVGFLRRTQVLSVWRSGEAFPVSVVDIRQASSAPLSRVLRFTLGLEDRRVYSTLIPASLARHSPGDSITIIAPRTRPDRAILASLYQD